MPSQETCYRDIIFGDGCTASDVACHCSKETALNDAMIACINTNTDCANDSPAGVCPLSSCNHC